MINNHDRCIHNYLSGLCEDKTCVCKSCNHRLNNDTLKSIYFRVGYCGGMHIEDKNINDCSNCLSCTAYVDWLKYITKEDI